MSDGRPSLFWFRRDLRLADNPGLSAAASAGPVVPVFVLDPETEALGAAPLWRLGLSLARLGADLEAAGSRLVLRRGKADAALTALAAEVGARAVHWGRLYTPDAVARDRVVARALAAAGVTTASHPGHLLHEPEAVSTSAGGAFRVFTPFWRAIAHRAVAEPLPPPRLRSPAVWPAGERLEDWGLERRMQRGAPIVRGHLAVGEAAARERLEAFLAGPIGDYGRIRDRLDLEATSHLSENLACGEIAVASIWHAAQRAAADGAAGAAPFLRQLAWREFAWHLAWHTPHLLERNWRTEWDGFPWRADNEEAERWRRGMTGEPLVDAGMRALYATGRMHNRARLVVASYLCKHLLTHWKVGADWFADCLVDWDPASNALGWQWAAGSGPDAAPYFRIFSPARQAERFDPEGRYRRRFLRGWGGGPHGPEADAFFAAAPRAWGLDPEAPYPQPIVDLDAGRRRALAAHAAHRHHPSGP